MIAAVAALLAIIFSAIIRCNGPLCTGGFNALSGCTPSTYPYPESNTSFNSATTPFCLSQCPPYAPLTAGSYKCSATGSLNKCCAEWNASKDPTRAGMPDNFSYASNGLALQTALSNIINNITQQLGSSSAVATVAQQNTEGALIIRGAFEARAPTADTADSNRYLWFGHMESYWPDRSGNYDFQLFPTDTLCKSVLADSNAGGEANCWDAAITPPWPSPANRVVYTDKNGVLTLFNTTNITPTDLGLTSTDTTTRNAIVNWVLGTDQTGYKSRQYGGGGPYWILGDIVYSTPVVVVPPSLAAVPSKTNAIINSTETAVVAPPSSLPSNAVFKQFFLDWRQCDPYNTSLQLPSGVTCPGTHVRYRDKVVYVGANDGMVHAFLLSVYNSANQWWAIYPNPTSSSDTNSWNSSPTATDKARIKQIGQELWAYIPSNLLDQLPALANQTYGSTSGSNVCSHRFMVDLAETAPTAFFDNEYAN